MLETEAAEAGELPKLERRFGMKSRESQAVFVPSFMRGARSDKILGQLRGRPIYDNR